jgi:hypothetical protein
MSSRRRHKRVRRKKSKVGIILVALSGLALALLVLSVMAFYSGRYEILDRFAPPSHAEE